MFSFLDDSTVRAWRKAYEDGGVKSVYALDLKGGFSPLSSRQLDDLRD